jgi:large subunit ribosomal protein L10
MLRSDKERIVGELAQKFEGIMSVVLADYRGTDVNTVVEIRDEFRKADCEYRVLKNSLVKLAIAGSSLEPMTTLLAGPTAVIWSYDSPSAPAKIAVKYAKDLKTFTIKGGFFEGQILDEGGVDRLSKMPDKPECQATLLMTFLAAPQDFVRQIIAGPQNFMYLLDARRRSMGSDG